MSSLAALVKLAEVPRGVAHGSKGGYLHLPFLVMPGWNEDLGRLVFGS